MPQVTDLGLAPAWQVSHWFNTATPLDLVDLRGRVVVLHAFQMLCPACVLYGVPQAERIHQHFDASAVQVVGIHTVFEHHAAMQPVSLEAFLHEFRVTHPIGIDRAVPGQRIPATMQTYALKGTPSLVLIDRLGHIRLQHFGRLDDMFIGAEVMRLSGP
jgi:thiol-disulfide isomerase/thioredoxin